MRASTGTVLFAAIVLFSQTSLAETKMGTDVSPSSATTVSLADIAAREHARLGAADGPANDGDSDAQGSDIQADRAATAKRKKLRGKALRKHLAEAERLRVRSKYRELQLDLIASNSEAALAVTDDAVSSD